MLRLDTFWGTEKDAPLLKLNRGYLQSQGDLVLERVDKWPSLVGTHHAEPVVLVAVEKPDRILIADAERTFRSDANRASFVKLLAHLQSTFGDYAQGLSYVCSFLRLFLEEAKVANMMALMNKEEKYFPGYWKHEAIRFATDAYVFQELLSKHLPKLAEHLKKNGADPSVYCQKWFVGLCVHVLPFEYLFPYFEGFLENGYLFCFRFGLSLLTQLQDKLLATTSPSQIFGLLRLDPSFIPHNDKFKELLDQAFAGVNDFDLSGTDFKDLREKMYNQHLKVRIEHAHTLHAKGQNDSEDEIEDCQICKDDFPEVYCKECKLKMCETCHNKPPAGSSHLRSHEVKEIEEDEEDEKSEEEADDDEETTKKDKTIGKMTEKLEKLSV